MKMHAKRYLWGIVSEGYGVVTRLLVSVKYQPYPKGGEDSQKIEDIEYAGIGVVFEP